ncbi:hypothetical protein CEXT_317411, partial [Caerostris extrusa]
SSTSQWVQRTDGVPSHKEGENLIVECEASGVLSLP